MTQPKQEPCTGCKHRDQTDIFILCLHPKSRYVIADKADFHTCTHMRAFGGCGEQKALFEAVTL